MIEKGRVSVDGRIAQLGDQADPETQRITLDGVPIRKPEEYVYVMLHKPRGYISTTDDPQERRTVLDLVNLPQRLYPVGRLDADSEGMLLLTNDGTLTQHLTHPSYGHPRVYRVRVKGTPSDDLLQRWRRGIVLDGQRTRFDKVRVDQRERDHTWLIVTLHEGRKHMVRRIVGATGHPAQRLIRIQMGPLTLGNLPLGQWRHLTDKEISALQEEVGIARRRGKGSRRGKSRRGKGKGQSNRGRRR